MKRAALVFACTLAGLLQVGGEAVHAQSIPSPAEVLGYEIGERFTDVAGVERYFEALAGASELVTVDRYGMSPEGRPLVQALFASPEHRARLDEILRLNRELTDPDTPEERAREIAAVNPAIVYLTYGIHGNESASSEAALWTAHDLVAAGSEFAGVLDSLVIVMDPAANPDGRDRYVGFHRQAAQLRANPNPEIRERREPWPGGRFNHYLFDLNRDWAWLSQPETRMRLERYHRYSPQVHVDFHEMGYASSYFFFPAADPINPIYPDHILEWGRRFGDGNARAMDREGLLYYTGQNFDLFYPGYGDSWPSLLGAVGMTYEQAGGGFGGLQIERPDGSILTLRDRAFGHRTTGHATLETAAAGKSELLLGFAAFHRGVDDGLDDVYLVPGDDPSRALGLVALLRDHGIEVERADAEVRLDVEPHWGFQARDVLPAGAYRIRARQPRGRLAGALLRPDNFLDATSSYDITAWALPYAYGVEAHSAAGPSAGSWTAVTVAQGPSDPEIPTPGGYGYLLTPSFAHMPGLVHFLEREGRVLAVADGFEIDGVDYPAGTLFFPRGRNTDLDRRLEEAGLGGVVRPVASGRTTRGPDLGTDSSSSLRLPRVALLAGEGTTPTSFGVHWFFLEQLLDLPFDIVNVGDVRSVGLEAYDVILVPGGNPIEALGQDGVGRLEAWVRGGGTLVAVAAAARRLAGPLAGVEERTQNDGDLDRDDLLARALRSREERELEDWRERTPGTILTVHLDPGHPLSFGAEAGGLPGRTFVLSAGTAFEPSVEFETVAHFPEGLDRVSGVISDLNLERLERGAWLVDRRVGSGKVILLADDPLYRAFWYGGFQLYANAILLAPVF